jgi:hypothetical protein
MIGVKFFAVMARFPDPPVTEASAFQVSAPANRIAAVAASMSMSLRIVSSRFLIDRTRKAFTCPAKKQLGRVPQGSTAGGYDLFTPCTRASCQNKGYCRGNYLIIWAYSNTSRFLFATRARPGDNWLRA